jgi:Fe-S cluster biogenesis protein NfuA
MDKDHLILQINTALNELRPHLAVDGGNVEVVDVTDDFIVKIKWLGNCQNCSMSEMTLKAGVEETLKNKIPQIKRVEPVN